MNYMSLAPPGACYTNSENWFGMFADVAGPNLLPALQTNLSALRVGRAQKRPEASVMQELLYDDFQVQ